LPTGITPKKRAWNVQQHWERTEPRDVLIAALRQRAGRIETTVSEPEPIEISTELPSVSSTDSLDEKAREALREVNGLSTSQLGKTGKVATVAMGKKGFGFGVAEERPVLTVLGEGGVNIPRRVRK